LKLTVKNHPVMYFIAQKPLHHLQVC